MKRPRKQITALIHLVRFYNPDAQGNRRAVEEEKFEETAEEIARRFGGGFLHAVPGKGFWWSKGVIDRDDVLLLEVDVPNKKASREWLRSYARDVLMKRFEQKAIYVRFVPTEALEVSEDETIT